MKSLHALRSRLARGRSPSGERVAAGLKDRSQVELKEIEAHERANGARPEVLDKLRYLRGREPLEGYDALEPEEIAPVLERAGIETLDAVREYERKFRRRSEVLEEIARIRHGRVASQSR